MLAVAETWDNGKPIRETLAADLPLAIDHFRYFAGCIRAQEGSLGELDDNTVAYHFHEPLGVVGQIIPWNFPLLMAAWKLAPALAAGNCVVLKPAEQTPARHPRADGAGRRPAAAGRAQRRATASASRPASRWPPASASPRSPSPVRRPPAALIMQYASENLIPVTLELGGKSPNIFFADVFDDERRLRREGARGLRDVRAQPGRGVHLPVARAGAGAIYDAFMERAVERIAEDQAGQPAGHRAR